MASDGFASVSLLLCLGADEKNGSVHIIVSVSGRVRMDWNDDGERKFKHLVSNTRDHNGTAGGYTQL